MEKEKRDYNKIAKILGMALIDDFRGFLLEGVKRLEVKDDELHAIVALNELLKIPGWEHESGVGENTIIELLKERRAIYITKIQDRKNPKAFHRSIGYIAKDYSDVIEYRGRKVKAAEVLREIAIGMGYDVDEYELLKRTEHTSKTPVRVMNYKGSLKIRRSKLEIAPPRSVKEGDVPQFNTEGNLIGFISGGKFISASHYPRYNHVSLENIQALRAKSENTNNVYEKKQSSDKKEDR